MLYDQFNRLLYVYNKDADLQPELKATGAAINFWKGGHDIYKYIFEKYMQSMSY